MLIQRLHKYAYSTHIPKNLRSTSTYKISVLANHHYLPLLFFAPLQFERLEKLAALEKERAALMQRSNTDTCNSHTKQNKSRLLTTLRWSALDFVSFRSFAV